MMVGRSQPSAERIGKPVYMDGHRVHVLEGGDKCAQLSDTVSVIMVTEPVKAPVRLSHLISSAIDTRSNPTPPASTTRVALGDTLLVAYHHHPTARAASHLDCRLQWKPTLMPKLRLKRPDLCPNLPLRHNRPLLRLVQDCPPIISSSSHRTVATLLQPPRRPSLTLSMSRRLLTSRRLSPCCTLEQKPCRIDH